MTRVKRAVAMLLVMLTLMSCNITGFAATKPTAKCTSHPTTVNRGKVSKKFLFNLRVGSYNYKSNFYRAGIAFALCKNSMTSTQCKTYITKTPSQWIFGFDRNYNGFWYTFNVDKRMSTGKWKFVYATFYRTKNANSAWTINKSNIKMFTITVK